MLVATTAATGFTVYKTVQLSGGGSAEVQFPSKDGKTLPPEPLPHVGKVAVWPGDEVEVAFAQRLQTSGKFAAVASPAVVSSALSETRTPADLKQLTDQEQAGAFNVVCHRTGAGLVLGARRAGASVNNNVFSLSRSNVTYTAELFGYACDKRQMVWHDTISLVVEQGSSTANNAELNRISADAWAERIEQATGLPSIAKAH